MKYADARDKILTGDVLAWSHRGLTSWYDFQVMLVRMFTCSEYSHVGVAWVTAGRVFILESVGAGVRIFPLSLELPFYHLPWKNLSVEQLEFALGEMGKPYSKWEAIKAFFGKNDIKNGRWECAEYVAAIHNLPCLATPSDVVAYLLENGAVLTQVTA